MVRGLITTALLFSTFAGCGGGKDGERERPAPAVRVLEKPERLVHLYEALELYDRTRDELSAVREPDVFLYTFDERIRKFPPLHDLESLSPRDRHRTGCLFNGYALALQHKGRVEEAVEIFEWVVRVAPALQPARFNLAVAYYEARRDAEAGAHFRALLEKDLPEEHRRRAKAFLEAIARGGR